MIKPEDLPAELVPGRFQVYYYLNPMAGIIDGYRPVLTMAEPQWPFVGLAAAVSLLIFLGATLF